MWVICLNPSFERMSGYSRSKLFGKPLQAEISILPLREATMEGFVVVLRDISAVLLHLLLHD